MPQISVHHLRMTCRIQERHVARIGAAWNSVRVPKGFYPAACAMHPRRTWNAWRKRNLRGLGLPAGENVVDTQ